MRRNVLLSILLTIIILLALLPFFDGILVQKRLKQVLHQLNSQTVNNEIVNYQRGWFSSKVTVLWTLPAKNLSGKWIINIQHGPWFGANDISTSAIFGLARFHITILADKMKFAQFLVRHTVGEMNIDWHFNNVLTGIFTGFKLKYRKNQQDIIIHSTATSANFYYILSSKKIILHGIIGGLTAEWEHHNKLRILPSLFSMQGKIDGQMVLLGNLQLHIPLIMWQGIGHENLLLQNFNLTSEHYLNEMHRIDYLNKATVELLSYQHRRYAPSQWLSTGENLTINALTQQRIWLTQWWRAILTKKALFQPSQWKGLQQQLVAYYQNILAEGGQVQQHATLNTSLGNLQIDFYVNRPKPTAKMNLQLHWQIAKPLTKLWLYYACRNLSSKTSLTSSVLTTEILTDNLLNHYQALGLLQKRGADYIGHFNYSG